MVAPMSRYVAMTLMTLAMLASSAEAETGLLTKPEARRAVTRSSLAGGATRTEIRRCRKLAPRRARCIAAEWGNEAIFEGFTSEGIESVFWVGKRPRGIRVVWLDFNWIR